MANYVMITGRLVKDPELKYTTNSIPVMSTTLAVAKNFNEGADYIQVTLWRKNAENVAKYLKKGSKLLVEGAISTRVYEGQNGTQYITEVIASRVEFLDTKSDDSDEPREQRQRRNAPQQPQDDNHDDSELDKDGLPF